MRIAHITPTFPPYLAGTGWVCYYNAQELARRGHQVSVYTAAQSGIISDSSEFQVHRLPAWVRVGNAPVLPGLFRLRDVDIIHLHHPFISGAEFVALHSQRRHIPFVLTHHNDLIGDGLRRYLFDVYGALFIPFVLRAARKLAVVSSDYAASSRHRAVFAQRKNDVVEIPNGVDTELFHPAVSGSTVRDAYSIPTPTRVILFVGALDRAHHFKGLEHLLKAFALLDDENAVLMIVGDGDLGAYYRSLADTYGIGPRTIFAGAIPHARLPQYYAAADVVILPSVKTESFGMVLVEAMACGKPVIASNLPGVRTVVSDGQDGVLVPPGDVETLKENIKLLLDDPPRRRRMGERGRAKVELKYSWKAIVPRLETMYADALRV